MFAEKARPIVLGIFDAIIKNFYLVQVPVTHVVNPLIARTISEAEAAEVFGGKLNTSLIYRRLKRVPIVDSVLPVGHLGGMIQLPNIKSPKVVDFVIQEHNAKRAGCLPSASRILTDQGLLRIGDIVKEKRKLNVLSYNFSTNQVEWKPVTNWFNNGSTGEWLSVTTTKKGAITLTPSHNVYSTSATGVNLVPASNLSTSSSVLCLDKALSDDAKQFMLGSLLGDSSTSKYGSRVVFSFGQSKRREEYARFAANLLGARVERRRASGNKSDFYYIRTRHKYNLTLWSLFYPNGRKSVIPSTLPLLDNRSIAAWFMDDGQWSPSRSDFRHNRLGGRPRNLGRNTFAGQIYFHTQGFTHTECATLAAFLNSKLDCNFKIRSRTVGVKTYYYLASNSISSNQHFFTSISPYIHSCLGYKSPLEVGSYKWEPATGMAIFPVAVSGIQRKEIFSSNKAGNKKWKTVTTKFDIEVADNHNYFSGGILVSNSHYDLRLHIGGKAVSWASRKPPTTRYGLKALYHQPDHAISYSLFEGEIAEGYGAGTVRIYDSGKAIVQSEILGGKPGIRVRFYGTKTQGDYTIFHSNGDKNRWGIVRHHEMPKHGQFPANEYTTKFDESVWTDPNLVASEKIDGANMTAAITKKGLSISSRRLSITGKPIYRTDNVPHIRDTHLPKRFQGTIVQGELAAGVEKNGIFIADYETTSGILNSKPYNAVETQTRVGPLKYFLFEIIRSPLLPRNATYGERRALLEEIVREAKNPNIRVPKMVTDDKKGFYEKIINTTVRPKWNGSHEKRGEGVVLKNLSGDRRTLPFKWIKAKTSENFDLAIAGFTPGENRFQDRGIGTFLVKDATGRVVGRVGSGLTDEVRLDAYKNPGRYLDKVIEVKCMQATKDGRLRASRLERFRPDKDLGMLDTIRPTLVGPTNRSQDPEDSLRSYIRASFPEAAKNPDELDRILYSFKSKRNWRRKP